MKKLTFANVFLIATLAISASGQVKLGLMENNRAASIPATAPGGSPVDLLGTKPEMTSEKVINAANAQPGAIPDLGFDNSDAVFRRTISSLGSAPLTLKLGSATIPTAEVESRPAASSIRIAAPPSPSATTATVAEVPSAALATDLTQVYRIGVGDVLDIRLADNPGYQSTLFTVLDGGLLDYPLAGDPVHVAGLTTAEVAAHLRERVKVLERPAVVVNVRDYASHSVTITGFVGVPGLKILRREAVPLYVVLSEAMPFSEAGRATIIRQGHSPVDVDLGEATTSVTLVVPGDVIKVSGMPPAPTEFFFAGGEVNSPGQKPFHSGLTLTQAILASGGRSKNAGIEVRLSRQGVDGKLVTSEYNLDNIQSGRIPDPALQKGDRLEIGATQ
jgi:protein involved in polysaccharide export with SLBB domain